MPEQVTTILLADDHTVLREGLRRILEREPDLEVVGEAETGEAALELVDRLRPDVVVMDVRMPGMGGIEATRRLRESNPYVQVVVLSAYPDYAREALETGAAGYVLKTAPTPQLLACIRAVATGSLAIQRGLPGVTSWALAHRDHSGGGLSERECAVLRLIARGLTNRSIARQLGIAPRTADQHVHNMLVKIGVASRAQAVRYAIDHELTSVID